jgi:predicted O-methyltransferase YrrM
MSDSGATAGASISLAAFLDEVVKPDVVSSVAGTIDRLSTDPSLDDYRGKLRAISGRAPYWDLACALRCLTRLVRPDRYLEIGVRRGKSMAQVVVEQPRCDVVGIDLWVTPYGGVDNPGPAFVREEMTRLGHRGELALFSGDSREVLPRLIAESPDRRFDLITVDGDHTDEGAWRDLATTVELLRPGGWLVFDDLVHPLHTLLPVWHQFASRFADLVECAENVVDHTGTAVARRKSSGG